MANLEVKMIDIHEWDAEESLDKREEEKNKMKKLLEISVTVSYTHLTLPTKRIV